MTTISIEMEGYWREVNVGGVPNKSGVYCVYECTHNKTEKTVTLNKLIYIGESADVGNRLANHEKKPDWKKHVRSGNELCYSFGQVPSITRERAEAALIYKHKPPVNTEYVDNFPFPRTTISLTGRTALLSTSFTVG
jgi:GIY-YIG catalytic domain.